MQQRNGLVLSEETKPLLTFDFCLSITSRFDNKHTRSCLASSRLVAGRGPMAQGKSLAAHWLSLPFYTPEGAWPLSPLAPAAGSRWPVTTGAMPGRDVPCYFRRLRQYPRFCDFVFVALPLTSCCSKLSSWRSRMGDGQVVGRLLSQPG